MTEDRYDEMTHDELLDEITRRGLINGCQGIEDEQERIVRYVRFFVIMTDFQPIACELVRRS